MKRSMIINRDLRLFLVDVYTDWSWTFFQVKPNKIDVEQVPGTYDTEGY